MSESEDFKAWFIMRHGSDKWTHWYGDAGEYIDEALLRLLDSFSEYVDEILKERGLK